MKSNLPNIYFYKFIFNLEALEDMQLPEYKGSMFRGAFGWNFRKPVCITGMPTCDNCILQTQCSYFIIFETEMPGHNIPFLIGVKKVPHPFVIHPHIDRKIYYKKGEILKVGLTIFGDMIDYFPYFVYTFIRMGKRGIGYQRKKYKLSSVYNLGQKGDEFTVFKNEDQKLIINYKKIESPDIIKQRTQRKNITLNFNTPLRLQESGKIITDPDSITPTLIIRNIERRIIVLSHFFCHSDNIKLETEINDDEISISDNRLKPYYWKRYSSRQNKNIDLSGFIGKITFHGNIKKYYPLLLIGEKINIGKNTLFGLGEYLIE